MFHICPNEIMAFMMALPFLGAAYHWIAHKLRGETPCEDLPCELTECHHEAVGDPTHDA